MKSLIGAAASGLCFSLVALAGVAAAQTGAPAVQPAQAAPVAAPPTACPAIPAAPTLPDGAKAKSAQMEKGNQEFMAWAATADASINCLKNEFMESEKVMKARLETANAAIRASNETRNSWVTQVQAYCKRIGNPKGCATEATPAPAQ